MVVHATSRGARIGSGEAAAILRVSVRHVARLHRAGHLRGEWVAGRLVLRRADVARLAAARASREAEGPPAA